MGVIAAYRRVFGNPALARLLFGEFVSSVGDWLYLVALLVVVYAESNDVLALGVIGAARILPYVLLSIPAGIAADRFDRRKILIVTDVARGLLMLLIAAAVAVGAPVIVIVGLAVTATCFASFFSPAIGSFLPSLVRDESELGPANSAWSSLDNLAFFIGPALAAVLLSLGNLVLAFLLNALTFGIVALVLWRLPSQPARATTPAAGAAADGDAVVADADAVVADARPQPAAAAVPAPASMRSQLSGLGRPLLALGLINIVSGFVFGGLSVMTVILAFDVFGVGDAGTGLLNSAVGVGGIVGAVVAGALVLRRRLGPPLAVGALVVGLSVAALGQLEAFSLALVAMAIASAGSLLVEIVTTTLFQRIVPDAIRGRALGTMETVSVLAYAAGSFVLPVAGAGQPGAVLLGSGIAMGVAGVLTTLLLGRYALQEPAIDPARRRLAEVDLFAGLPPARLEAAMRAAVVVDVPAGEVVIRQGDAADRFYVIAEGEVEVTQVGSAGGAPVVLRRLGSGDFFGEFGLLSGVPRTATVTALTDLRLAALDREPFLELVSAGPGLTYRLLDVHRGASTVSG
jgi:MFS family permease